jgi:hypothetical protein
MMRYNMNKINNYIIFFRQKKKDPGLKVANKLNSFPDSRCKSRSECISLITPGSRNVFVTVKYFVVCLNYIPNVGRINLGIMELIL